MLANNSINSGSLNVVVGMSLVFQTLISPTFFSFRIIELPLRLILRVRCLN